MKPKMLWIFVAVAALLGAGVASPAFGETIIFPPTPLGDSTQRPFEITNSTSSPVDIYLYLSQPAGCGFSLNVAKVALDANASSSFTVTFSPSQEEECTAYFYALRGWDVVKQMQFTGTVSLAQTQSRVGPITIGECDTGIMDREYGGGMLSEKVKACFDSAQSHGQAVNCIAKLSKKLKKEKILSAGEIQALRRCAAQAKAP